MINQVMTGAAEAEAETETLAAATGSDTKLK